MIFSNRELIECLNKLPLDSQIIVVRQADVFKGFFTHSVQEVINDSGNKAIYISLKLETKKEHVPGFIE